MLDSQDPRHEGIGISSFEALGPELVSCCVLCEAAASCLGAISPWACWGSPLNMGWANARMRVHLFSSGVCLFSCGGNRAQPPR